MATTRASKLISLTNLSTGAPFYLSTNKIIKFSANLANASYTDIKYITQSGKIVVKTVTEAVATIYAAALTNTGGSTTYATQAVTLLDGTVVYLSNDRIIYGDSLTASTLITYDEGSEAGLAPSQYEATLPTAANLAAATLNLFSVVTQPYGNVPSKTRYINNLFVAQLVGEPVTSAPVITFTTRVKSATGVVTTAGSGYVAPTVTITGGGGSGATGTLTTKIVSGVVAAAGTGYVPTDTITLTGGTFTSAGVYNVATTKLISTAVNAAGSGYATGNTITLAGGTFSTAAILTVSTTQLVSAAVNSGGAGYSAGDTITLAGGTFSSAAILTVATEAGGVIQTFTISTPGSYTVNSTSFTQSATSGGGTGATFNLGLFGVLTNTVSTAGSYTVNAASFTQSATSGTGTGATFNTVVYGVNTLTVNAGGSYTVIPSNPVAQGATSGSGTGATVTASFGINTFVISTTGTGFTSYPTFTVVDAGGTSAVVTASMEVETPMTIVDGGTGINTAPTLTFSATTGTLATATATISAALQTVTSTTLTQSGAYKKGTDTYPSLAITGGVGSIVLYDEKNVEFIKLQLESTVSTVATAVNAL